MLSISHLCRYCGSRHAHVFGTGKDLVEHLQAQLNIGPDGMVTVDCDGCSCESSKVYSDAHEAKRLALLASFGKET